jgi:hypothetical protein
MPAGAVARVTVVVSVTGSFFGLGFLSHDVGVSSSVNDPNFENNTATIVTPVNRPPVATRDPISWS